MNEIQYGFGMSTSDEYLVEENAKEREIKLTDRIWNELSEDWVTLEKNVLKVLSKHIGDARSEGHDSYGELIGSIWVKKGSEGEKLVREVIEDEEPWRTGSGTFPFSEMGMYEGTSQYSYLIDIDVWFYK